MGIRGRLALVRSGDEFIMVIAAIIMVSKQEERRERKIQPWPKAASMTLSPVRTFSIPITRWIISSGVGHFYRVTRRTTTEARRIAERRVSF
jgi:hypothetical protein